MPATFRELGVPAPIASVLDAAGKAEAFPIQEATLPDTLAGRDVLGRGRTGSGKTIAFSVPMVARLAESGHKRVPGRPRGLVLAPTRELATQIAATMTPLAAATSARASAGNGIELASFRAARVLRAGGSFCFVDQTRALALAIMYY